MRKSADGLQNKKGKGAPDRRLECEQRCEHQRAPKKDTSFLTEYVMFDLELTDFILFAKCSEAA